MGPCVATGLLPKCRMTLMADFANRVRTFDRMIQVAVAASDPNQTLAAEQRGSWLSQKGWLNWNERASSTRPDSERDRNQHHRTQDVGDELLWGEAGGLRGFSLELWISPRRVGKDGREGH